MTFNSWSDNLVRKGFGALAALSLALQLGAVATAQAMEASIHLRDAEAMAARAEKAATAAGGHIAIVVVNPEGRVILSHRMDDATFVNLSVAESKAVAAAGTAGPTSDIQKEVAGGSNLLLSIPGLVAIAGGVPIVRGGTLIGGIGVSGGAPEEDERIAKLAAGA